MLTDTLRTMVNNLFKESFYGKKNQNFLKMNCKPLNKVNLLFSSTSQLTFQIQKKRKFYLPSHNWIPPPLPPREDDDSGSCQPPTLILVHPKKKKKKSQDHHPWSCIKIISAPSNTNNSASWPHLSTHS